MNNSEANMSVIKDGEHVLYKDPAGNTIRFYDYKGMPFPILPGDMTARMAKMPDFKARPDDVYICGYVKCGTTWVWEVTNMLISGLAENIKSNKQSMMLELKDAKELDDKPSPRVLNTHLLLPDLPKDVIAKNSRIIYLLRNPKDVCVSHFHHDLGLSKLYHYHGDWENYFQLWLNGHVDYGSFFDYVKHWEKQLELHPNLNVHVLHFEDLKLNFIEEAKKLASFLGVKHEREFYEKLAEKSDFKTMKAFKEDCYSEAEHAFWRGNKSNFFRKGIVGDWKTQFTVAQNEQFDAILKEKLQGSQLQFTYEA